MKTSDYIAGFLAEQGVTTVYEMAGGMITHLLDSLHRREDIRVVSIHHEQAAAFAAEAGARMTGVPGVAMATSGPGATNLLTGIGSCFFDSVPVVFITGQVNTNEQRGDAGVRQAGFQETDIVAIAAPVTKAAWRVRSADEIPELLERAFATALEGRPGPVLIDIPMNVQRDEVDALPVMISRPAEKSPSPQQVRAAVDALTRAKRPLIIAGGGTRADGEAVRELVETLAIPVVHTLMATDLLPYAHPLRVGLIGTYGNRWANLAVRDADALLVLGARLDVRQTGADVEGFSAGKTIVHVDVDPAQLAWRVPAAISIEADAGAFVRAVLTQGPARRGEHDAWRETIAISARPGDDTVELAGTTGINPAEFMHALSQHAREALAYVTDVGQNQMWAAQSLRLRDGQRFLTSGGMGAMGFALPSAIGAALAVPGRPIVAISGDGGFQVNIQELETVARLGLPIKMIVLNNCCLGMVRQFQHEFFEARYQSTVWGYGAPDFVAVSSAYGVPARRVREPEGIDEALEWLMTDPNDPALLEVTIDRDVPVRPKVAFGDSVFRMSPPPPVRDSE